jgi:cysteine-rich repeat protein
MAFVLLSASAGAQTTITGGQVVDETWTAGGSPYIVQGDVFVPAGAYLHIGPGVEVQVATGDAQSSTPDTTRVAISISGALRIDGTKDEPVHIHAQTGDSIDTWHGIVIQDTATEAKLSYTTLEHSRQGVDANSSVIEIYACEFANNRFHGVNLEDGAEVFDRVMLRGMDNYGVRVAGGTVTMSNVIALQNGQFGFFLPGGTVTIYNSAAHDNDLYGMSCTGADVTLRNTNVTQNGAFGIYQDAGAVTAVTSNIWGNISGALSGSVTTVDVISTDPDYVNGAQGDLKLQSTSVCIDRGIDNGAPMGDYDNVLRPVDGDNTGGADYDIGPYEYFETPFCGDAAVGGSETCDDGASNGTYGFCNGTCDGLGPFCGDGNTDAPFETCDDGNTDSGDGCDAFCMVEGAGGAGGGATGGAGGAGGASSAGGMGTGGAMMQICSPGAQVTCPCPSGEQGVQLCNEDGTAFGVCACPNPNVTRDEESGCGCRLVGVPRVPRGSGALFILAALGWLVRRRAD